MKNIIKLFVLLFSLLVINNAIASEDIAGKWQGKLELAPGSELVIQFIITKNDDGSYSVVLDSPDQGAIKNIKANSVVYDSGSLKLEVTELSGSYEGTLKDGIFEGNWKQEGTSIPLNMKPYEKPVLTKEDKAKLVGQWHGELKVPTGSYTLLFRFEMKEDEEFRGFLDIPDTGSKGIPVADTELSDGEIRIKIPAAQLEYKGKLAENEVVGEVILGGAQKFPVTLKKGEYKAPTYSLNLPKEVMEGLIGEWHGQLKMPANMMHVECRFEKTEKGEFVGSYGVPDQNIKGLPLTEASFSDGKLTLKIKVANAEFKGKLEGDKLTGEWAQAGLSNIPLTLKKGEYVPPVYNLNLPEETKEGLTGEWHGQLKMPTSIIHVAFRFETTEKGEFLGFHDLPDQGVKDRQVYEADFSDGKLTLKVANVVFKGELTGDELTGEWTQAGNRIPITLKKGEYVPPVYNLDLPKETKELLSGEWPGELEAQGTKITVVFRFETTEKGEFVGFEDVPDQGATIPVIEASIGEGKLSLKVPDAEFKGELKGDEITGEAIQPGRSFPFKLKKGKYVPTVYGLTLSKENMKILSGKWEGQLGTLTLTMKFEKNEKGDFVGSVAIPQQRIKGVPVVEASLSDGKLALKLKLADIEIKGKLKGDAFDGEWLVRGTSTPLSLKKVKD